MKGHKEMIVKLIKNPWANTDELPYGLTLNKKYKCIDIYKSDFSFNEYFIIINDSGDEEAYNKLNFIVVESECKQEHNSLVKAFENLNNYIQNIINKQSAEIITKQS